MANVARRFDVVVVGGGPAGLSAAAWAAKGDTKVVVIEKDPGIASTIRTSGVSWLQEMEKLGVDHEFYNPIRRYGFISPNKEYVLETSKAEACVLDVKRLYQYLAHKAVSLGVDIILQTKVDSASYENGGTSVRIATSSQAGHVDFSGSYVIDASGFSTVVGRSLGFVNKWEKYGVGAECEAYAEKVDVETWALMVGHPYSLAGYAWIFPVGANRVRIGVGIGRPASEVDPSRYLTYLMEKKPGPFKRLGRICPLEYHYGVVPSQGPRNHTVSDRVMLVGDSAGHLNPLLLEGIRFAMKFGRMAGDISKQAIDKADVKGKLDEYEKRWRGEVWSDFQIGVSVQKEWLKLSDEQWDKEIATLVSLSPIEALELLQCRFSTRKLMKMLASHPELLSSRLFSVIAKAKMKRSSLK